MVSTRRLAGRQIQTYEFDLLDQFCSDRYGVSFGLVTGPRNAVYAINVTDRYAPPSKEAAKADPNKTEVRIRVWNADRSERVATKVTVVPVIDRKRPDSKVELAGTSPSNTADMNDMLEFELRRGSTYELQIKNGGEVTDTTFNHHRCRHSVDRSAIE